MPLETLSGLQTQIYGQLDGNSDLYPAAELTRAINEQIRVLNLYTGFLQSSDTITTQANRHFYDVPDGILVPLAVDLDDRELRRSSLAALARRRRLWLRETTANLGMVSTWVPIGIRKIAIHPADAVGSRTLRVTGIAEPTALSAAGDIVQVPDEMLDAVEALTTHVLQLKEGGKTFADASSAYNAFLGQVKEWERWKRLKHPRYWVEKVQEKVA